MTYYATVADIDNRRRSRLVWVERLGPGRFRHTPLAETFTSAREAEKRMGELNCNGPIQPPDEAGIERAAADLARRMERADAEQASRVGIRRPLGAR